MAATPDYVRGPDDGIGKRIDTVRLVSTVSGTPVDVHREGAFLGDPENTAARARIIEALLGGMLAIGDYQEWSVPARPASGSKATATKAAAAGVRHVAIGASWCLSGGVGAVSPINIDLIDGASGGATRLWTGALGTPAAESNIVVMRGAFKGSANTDLTAEFAVAAVGALQAVTVWGYSVPA